MRHMRIILNDPSDDLKNLLKLIPNLSRLRIRGNLGSNEVTDHFEKMAKSLFLIVPQLQKFDCELYCAAFEQHSKELIINQLHPLFIRVRCLFGPSYNQCYATDVSIYPVNNEYQSEYFRRANVFRITTSVSMNIQNQHRIYRSLHRRQHVIPTGIMIEITSMSLTTTGIRKMMTMAHGKEMNMVMGQICTGMLNQTIGVHYPDFIYQTRTQINRLFFSICSTIGFLFLIRD